jgi:hypothetical protein
VERAAVLLREVAQERLVEATGVPDEDRMKGCEALVAAVISVAVFFR